MDVFALVVLSPCRATMRPIHAVPCPITPQEGQEVDVTALLVLSTLVESQLDPEQLQQQQAAWEEQQQQQQERGGVGMDMGPGEEGVEVMAGDVDMAPAGPGVHAGQQQQQQGANGWGPYGPADPDGQGQGQGGGGGAGPSAATSMGSAGGERVGSVLVLQSQVRMSGHRGR